MKLMMATTEVQNKQYLTINIQQTHKAKKYFSMFCNRTDGDFHICWLISNYLVT